PSPCTSGFAHHDGCVSREAKGAIPPLPACGERVRPAAERAERSEAGVRGRYRKRRLPRRSAFFVTAPSPAAQACRLRRPSPRKRGEANPRLLSERFTSSQ